jgi:DNA-binding transcriptional regulator/RsmH inhibitor MraZ
MILPGCPEYRGNKRNRMRWRARRLKRFIVLRGELVPLDKAGRMIIHPPDWPPKK